MNHSMNHVSGSKSQRTLSWALAVLMPLTCALSFCPDLTAKAVRGGKRPEAARGAADLLARAFPEALEGEAENPRDGGELFRRTLDSDLFSSGSVGLFDVHVLRADELKSRRKADKLRDKLLKGLKPAADLVARLWPAGGDGLISGVRLPLVVADSKSGDTGYGDLIELLDYCERLGYSGWFPANEVNTGANHAAEVTRTWEVQVFNMADEVISDRPQAWIEHGCGYYALAFVANRSLRRGSWGLVPPWFSSGLIDELDIAAYDSAWVGQESWTKQTPGWYRAGWSGFVPQGSTPPPVVTGPPADLAVTVNKTGDPWLDFDASETRHWSDLAADRKTKAPVSFAYAAEMQSFLPRDRAAARCLMHLLLETVPADETLTALLDTPVKVPRDGMPDSEPLTVLLARAMGGVPEVDELEALSTRELLTKLERTDLIAALVQMGAEGALDLRDHREQSLWLSRQAKFDGRTRGQIFNVFLEVEYVQQMAEWKALAPRLDLGLQEALAASKRYPKKSRDVDKVSVAFRAALSADPAAGGEENGGQSSKKRSRSRRG